MARFIDKPPRERDDSRALQVRQNGAVGRSGQPAVRRDIITRQGPIPKACIVYGCAAAVLFLLALYFMFKLANWLTGLLLLILSFTLFGYAYYFMRYR